MGSCRLAAQSALWTVMVGVLPLLMLLGLEVPWKCGVTYPVTQGHNGGSHTGFGAWAWDFGMPVGAEVWAAAPGTVTHIKMNGNQGGCDPSFSSHANYVAIAHGDGTQALYLHLDPYSSPLELGDEVEAGALVGRVGLTGWVCGAHLHFQVGETCGSYWCQSINAHFDDYGDPAVGTQVMSTNCPPCLATLNGGQTEINELDSGCFERQTAWWWSSTGGLEGHHFYTIASDADAPETIGIWHFEVVTPGEYRVEAFIPDDDADAQGAVYEIHAGGSVDLVPVDQASEKGWRELGVFTFTGAEGERVQLGDKTGESTDLARRLAFDELRLTFVPPEEEAEDTTGGGTDDGSTGHDPTLTSGSGVDGSDETDGDAGGTSSDALPPSADEEAAGCGCRSADGPQPTGMLGLAGFVLAIVFRRRGR